MNPSDFTGSVFSVDLRSFSWVTEDSGSSFFFLWINVVLLVGSVWIWGLPLKLPWIQDLLPTNPSDFTGCFWFSVDLRSFFWVTVDSGSSFFFLSIHEVQWLFLVQCGSGSEVFRIFKNPLGSVWIWGLPLSYRGFRIFLWIRVVQWLFLVQCGSGSEVFRISKNPLGSVVVSGSVWIWGLPLELAWIQDLLPMNLRGSVVVSGSVWVWIWVPPLELLWILDLP